MVREAVVVPRCWGVTSAGEAADGFAAQQGFVRRALEVWAAVDHLVPLLAGIPLADLVHPYYPPVLPVAPARRRERVAGVLGVLADLDHPHLRGHPGAVGQDLGAVPHLGVLDDRDPLLTQ